MAGTGKREGKDGKDSEVPGTEKDIKRGRTGTVAGGGLAKNCSRRRNHNRLVPAGIDL